MAALTPLPDAPAGIAGVLNLHGQPVGVVDLRLRLGGTPREFSPEDRLLIVRSGQQRWALAVDEIIETRAAVPQPLASLSNSTADAALRCGEELVLILNPDRLV